MKRVYLDIWYPPLVYALSVPHISTYDVTVVEGRDAFARIEYNRTGGNLAIRSRIFSDTVQSAGMQ